MPKLRSLIVLLLVLVGAAAPAALAQVTIDKKSPTVVTKYFDPKRPPADMPKLKPNEAAVCVSGFSINAGGSGDVVDQTQTNAGLRATVKLTQISLELGCEIVIWLPDKATAKIVEHENGHRQITERFYKSADDIATRLAKPWIGKQVVSVGDDVDKASRKAIESAVNQITEQYMAQTFSEATKVQEAFDRITVHGTNKLSAKQGIDKSFDEYERGKR